MRNWIRQTGVYLIGVVIIFLLLANLLKPETHITPTSSEIIQTDSSPDKQILGATTETIAPENNIEESTAVDQTFYGIISVIDGDTVKINFDDKTESVRLIGIDSEELSATDQRQKCLADLAKSEADKMLKGKKIGFESDPVSGERDKYNRLLGYIFVDGTNFNKYMVENGFAHEYTYNKQNYKYQSELKAAENQAKVAKKGLWSGDLCQAATAPSGDSTVSASTPASQSTAPTGSAKVGEIIPPVDPPAGCLIKGNISSSDKIYHNPGGSFYDRTKISEPGERWFCSEEEAVAAGWRKSSR